MIGQQPEPELQLLDGLRRASIANAPGQVFQQTQRVSFYGDLQNWAVVTVPLTHDAPPKACGPAGVLAVDGIATTDTTGVADLLLSKFSCHISAYEFLTEPVILLATAIGKHPIIMTAEGRFLKDDLQMKFYSWNPAGHAAAEIWFSWQLIVGREVPPAT